jgi:tungstate transport system ATP-binding protein
MESILPLSVENLVYRAGGSNLVDGINFKLETGLRTILLGPNGAGKSLTLRLCHGLLQPTSGTVSWHGRNASNEVLREQAMVFQRPVLLRRSVIGNITYALALRGISRSHRTNRAVEALTRTGLGAMAQRAARRLSVGEQQRLALARAWALTPQILFLDEPTANLDPAATRQVEDIINAMHITGTKIVMTTHDIAQARRLADEVLFLHRGQLLEKSTAEHFLNEPSSEKARAFLKGELLW